MFATFFIDDMFDVCKLVGTNAVLFMSNDDKTRIPLGLAVANLQAPILIHVEYKVRLIDRNLLVDLQHKLISSG